MKMRYILKYPEGEEIASVKTHTENGEIIVDVEYKEKFEPKDGDFLVSAKGNIFIYDGKFTKTSYGAYLGINSLGSIQCATKGFSGDWTNKQGCRYATEQEKNDFLARLEKECKKRWNEETKLFEDIRWRAEEGNKYFTVSDLLDVLSHKDYYNTTDNEFYKLGNYFRTPEAAQKVADQIKEIFKNSKAE